VSIREDLFCGEPIERKTMMGRIAAASLAMILCMASAEATEQLTPETFQDTVANSGKSVFVKFFAPWCGHCKRMKPGWDKLAEEYEASSSVKIADVDCTEHQPLCSEHGVSGFPTLKIFKDGSFEGEPYQGGREFEQLKKYVEDNLEVACMVGDQSECSEKEIAYIEKWKGKDASMQSTELLRLQSMTGKSMTADLKKWLLARINLLQQVQTQ